MARNQKILLFFFAILLGIIITVLFVVSLNKEYLLSKLVSSANEKLYSYGYAFRYKDAEIAVFPPRFSLNGVLILNRENGNHVLEAKRSYITIRPLNLLFHGASPLSINVEQFSGKVDGKLLDLISRPPRSGRKRGSQKSFIPTLVLKEGSIEIIDPWKSIIGARLSVQSLLLSGNPLEGLGVIYTTGEDGITATVRHEGVEYPLRVTALHLNSYILAKKIEIKKITVNSSFINLSVRGRYDVLREKLKGKVTGDITPDEIARQFHIGALESLFEGGSVSFSGDAALERDKVKVGFDTELVKLRIKGFEFNGFVRCDYDNGLVALRNLAIDTPAGKLNGDMRFDFSSLRGEGDFNIQDFSPGRLVDYFAKKAVIGAGGIGNGHVSFSSPKNGTVIVKSALHMERGFSLFFRNMNEKIEWAEPVELIIEAFLTDLFKNPGIELNRLVIADRENRISLSGDLDLNEREGRLIGDVDIRRVKSLGLKGIFARSGAIRGNFLASGKLSKPLVESNFSFKDLSFSGLPAGNAFIKGSGILGGNISLIADYSSSIGNITFTGTYFPDEELYFTGSLNAEKVDISPFFSDNFTKKEFFDSLRVRFPLLFPVTGTISFSGDVALGKDIISATGKLHSDALRSPKMILQSVTGSIDYDDGILSIENISFVTFGGQIKAKGSFGEDRLELLGNFSNIDPNSLGYLVSEDGKGIGGESIEGAFHLLQRGKTFDVLDIHLTSDRITFQGADLTGLIVDGRKIGNVLSLTLSTADDLVKLLADFDLNNSELFCKVDLKNYPVNVTDGPIDNRLGIFGIDVSGSATILLDELSSLLGSPSDMLFKAETVTIDIMAAPYLTSYKKSLPEFHISGKKGGGGILLNITSTKAEGEVVTLIEQREKEGIHFRVRGKLNSGTLPVVLPSKILGNIQSDLLIDFEGSLSSFPKKNAGRFVLQNLNLEFPGELVTGDDIAILFDEGNLIIERSSISANQKTFTISGKSVLGGKTDLFLSGEYDAGLVNIVVKDVFENISGKVVGDIQLTGKFPDVEVSGQGVGRDVFIKFVGFKHALENVTTNVSFFKDYILFDSISGTMAGGDLEGSGEIRILKKSPVNLSFSADFYGVNLAYPEELPSKLEGSIELLGPVDNLFLRGEIFVDRAAYVTSIYPEKFLVDIRKKITKFSAPVGRIFAINLDLECVSDGTIVINNNIADATAGGTFRLLGDTSRPIIIGTFETIEGEVEFRGTQYTVERLLVDFDDPLSNNPKIDAFAKAEKGDYTVYVEVTGRLDNYSVELYSEPPLTKTDIVSLLSLGVTTEAYAANGSSVTTAGLATVALSPLKSQIEEGIRIFTGFERFSVESNYSSVTGVVEPTVVIGKTVGDRFSIDLSTSLVGTGTSKVVGEFKLIRDLYLRGDWTGGGTADEGEIGGELRVRKRFHGFSDFAEKLFGGEGW
jgi:hypothetical protein